MSIPNAAAELIAHFLRANGYTETLDAFVREAGLKSSIGTTPGTLTIESLLEEKRTFDVGRAFEKLGIDDGRHEGWTKGAPAKHTAVDMPSTANLLFTSIVSLDRHTSPRPSLLATTADRRLTVLDTPALNPRETPLAAIHESPILSGVILFGGTRVLTSSISGQITLSASSGEILDHRRDHAKYVVQITAQEEHDSVNQEIWVATAGWDRQVVLYHLREPCDSLPAPTASITLPTNPESVAITTHPDSAQPILIIARRDSSSLHFYTLSISPQLIGSQNLSPHSAAWVAFTPACIAISPTDPSLIAIATSSVPHMKLLIARLLVPPLTTPSVEGNITAVDQARADLARQEREAAALQVCCSALAAQTQYSTPALVWRPDGSGVWVNSDDGVVRGFEAMTGKLIATLSGGHEVGSKIRCLAAGMVEIGDGQEEEWLVSGGFDQKLLVWRP